MDTEGFHCNVCHNSFQTNNWFDTQKTRMHRGRKIIDKRKQTGCPKCHSSVSKMVEI